MTKTKIITLILFSLMLVLFIGCASEELTSAKLYIQQQDWNNAEIYLVKAMAVEPENPEIPYLLGDLIYGKNKDWGKMNEMFDKALSLGGDKVILQGGTVSAYVAQSQEKHWVTIYNKGIGFFYVFELQHQGFQLLCSFFHSLTLLSKGLIHLSNNSKSVYHHDPQSIL